MPRPTALRIPCPWSGDEHDPVPRSYHAWFWLYAHTRRLRHKLGLHDYQAWGIAGRRCTWCGHTKA
ncbi:hypothetical protein ACFXB3_07345 [Streptomyces sp. NPDC059447]|uniref:hypothetical protein n=1 Tax=Streptomyces sp. NPDC059447 TaxID=3346834 RepID=UPI0036C9219D